MIIILDDRRVVAIHDDSVSAAMLAKSYCKYQVLLWRGAPLAPGDILPDDFDIGGAIIQSESEALLAATDAVTGARGVEDLLAIIEHMAAHINQLQSLLQVQGMPEMKIIPPAALLERIAARKIARQNLEGLK